MRPITVRKAIASDKIHERYFAIERDPDPVVMRNIAVVEGTFSKETWLSAWLYVVRDGSLKTVNAFEVGRSPNRIGEPHLIPMKITLALGEAVKPNGWRIQLGSAGQTRGEGGHTGQVIHNIDVTDKQTFSGYLPGGKIYILHLEGDRKFNARRNMTVEEFANVNPGNFIVVAVALRADVL